MAALATVGVKHVACGLLLGLTSRNHLIQFRVGQRDDAAKQHPTYFWAQWQLGTGLTFTGDYNAAIQTSRTRQRCVSPHWFMHVYIGLGDRDKAFEWMEKRSAAIHSTTRICEG